MSKIFNGPDGRARCSWCSATDQYLTYHDTEWGFPVDDDKRLFEKVCLEGFQSGLSWRTILEKRENFREAFAGFDFHEVAKFNESDVAKLLQNEGIIRHRGKIEATLNNAKRALEMVDEFGSLAAYFWQHEPKREDLAFPEVVAKTPGSEALSKDLKKRGWKFVGPTTVYSFMQAMGLVNDHYQDCAVRTEVESAKKSFQRPHLK